METNQAEQIKRYVDIVFRRKALILTCFLLGIAAGLAFYLRQPKIYSSSSLLSYQQQRVNPARMSPDDELRIRDIVSTLTQIVTSRTNLEQIITDLELYEDLRQKMPMEDVIEVMRKNIEITPSNRGDTFQVAFSGSDPAQVARVTNALAARFIEENLKEREKRASETSAYTKDELQMAKEMLDRKEAILRDYKLKNYNEMPEQQTNNMARLIALQEQYQNRQDSIQDLERTRVLIQDQIAARRSIIAENESLRVVLAQGRTPQPVQVVESDRDRLKRLNAELQQLKQKYTDKHPAVKQLNRRITQLEQSLALEGAPQSSADGSEGPGPVQRQDENLLDLQLQLKDIALSIKALTKEKEELQKTIKEYETWVAAAPIREAEWSALNREHGELRRHYDFLVSQNLQAGSALNLERKQKGSQFRIEDSAQVPVKPIKPDFLRIMAIALAAGCGIGGALAFGLDLLDTSFRSPASIESALGVEVICSVPYLPLKREIIKKRFFQVLGWILFIAGCLAIAAAFVYFYQQGQIIL